MTSAAKHEPTNDRDRFDPLADLIVGTGSRPVDLAPINLRTVGPLLRALLVTDGTVTKFLEAVMMEPIRVQVRVQKETHLEKFDPGLRAEAGTRVIEREVELVGSRTGRHYAEAVSSLVVDRLPTDVVARLDSHPQGLGRLLLESALETRREVLWYGRERSSGPEPTLPGRIRRTYRIVSGGQPLILITESFPRDLELNP